MLNPAEADELIARHLRFFPAENVLLDAAHGRILAQEIHADRDFPPFDRVTFDGFALRAADLAAFPQGATRRFRISGLQAAGDPAPPLEAGGAVAREIMTGAMLPAHADSVVPYEDTLAGEGGFVTITESGAKNFTAGQSVHPRASDHRRGDILISRGTRLDGRSLAVAAACGVSELSVATVPRIAVVATGDELVEVQTAPGPQQIRRSNDVALAAALGGAGFTRLERFHFPDNREFIERSLARMLAEFDVLVLTGGVSKGKFDFLPAALQAQGVREIFHRVAQRPGKPLWFGGSARGTLVFALPGNPVSSYTCLHRYVLPALRRASGETPVNFAPTRVLLAEAAPGLPQLTCFLPVKFVRDQPARVSAQFTNTSGDFSGLLDSAGFVELPPREGNFPENFAAEYRPWQ